METLVTVGVVVVGATGGLVWWAWRAVAAEERTEERGWVSWWASRHGWSYGSGTDGLLGRFRGEPFDRGVSRDVQDVLSGGTCEGRPALLLQFSWYLTPDREQHDSTGTSGPRSGTCAALVVELPGPVPAMTIRRRTAADVAGPGDLETESGRFNAAFRPLR